MKKEKKKKGCLSKLITAVVVLFIVVGVASMSNKDDTSNTTTEVVKESEVKTTVATTEAVTTVATTTKAETVKETVEQAKGKSKDTSKLNITYFGDVRNDNTGRWRYSTFSEVQADFEEYALDYYNKYFKAENEIHGVINFARKTTYSVTSVLSDLEVCVYEYVDGEEHDANLMFSGTKLAQYYIDKDTGKIEEVD